MAWLEDIHLRMPLNQAVKSGVTAAINRIYSAEVVSCLGEPVTSLPLRSFNNCLYRETELAGDV